MPGTTYLVFNLKQIKASIIHVLKFVKYMKDWFFLINCPWWLFGSHQIKVQFLIFEVKPKDWMWTRH